MAVTINRYNKFPEYFGDNSMDLDFDTFTIILMNSTHTFTATNTLKSDISANEIPAGNGYTQGAETLASVTWVESSGTLTWDAADASWTASGGPIPTSGDCTDAVIYDETATAPLDGLCGAGTDFIIAFHASGIFTLS
jgi:hypothetical protein